MFNQPILDRSTLRYLEAASKKYFYLTADYVLLADAEVLGVHALSCVEGMDGARYGELLAVQQAAELATESRSKQVRQLAEGLRTMCEKATDHYADEGQGSDGFCADFYEFVVPLSESDYRDFKRMLRYAPVMEGLLHNAEVLREEVKNDS